MCEKDTECVETAAEQMQSKAAIIGFFSSSKDFATIFRNVPTRASGSPGRLALRENAAEPRPSRASRRREGGARGGGDRGGGGSAPHLPRWAKLEERREEEEGEAEAVDQIFLNIA